MWTITGSFLAGVQPRFNACPIIAAGRANFKQIWDDLERERAFDLVPHCKLAKVYDPALSRLELVISVAQHREHVRGALGQTVANRLVGQAPSGTLERALSSAIEQKKNVNFVAASRPDSPIRPRFRQDDWSQGVASDKELMDRATGKLLGTGGGAASSTLGQVPTSAEIEEVRGLLRGSLDLEFAAEEDAARELHSQSDHRQVASLCARDPIPPPRGHRLTLDSVSLRF